MLFSLPAILFQHPSPWAVSVHLLNPSSDITCSRNPLRFPQAGLVAPPMLALCLWPHRSSYHSFVCFSQETLSSLRKGRSQLYYCMPMLCIQPRVQSALKYLFSERINIHRKPYLLPKWETPIPSELWIFSEQSVQSASFLLRQGPVNL